MLEKLKGLKPWQKAAVGIITIGVTGTVIFLSVNAVKKQLKKKKDIKIEQDKAMKAKDIAGFIKNKYADAAIKTGGMTSQDNLVIQGWLKGLGELGYKYNNGVAEKLK